MWYPSIGWMCVRPSLCPPPMVSRYNLRTDFKFCTLKTVCLGSSYPATFHIISVFKLSQLLNQLSDHTEIRTWSAFYGTKQQFKIHFFQFSITFNNSFLPFQFPYPSIFATCYPFPEIFTSFPFPLNRVNSPLYPSVHSSSPTWSKL
jgi:hypothetical protein